ncbi:hypothetical protein DFH07DRAFT_783404 [Mycena maculata]|uniref:Uncharacterized protein n=1 Tax=Mycena maculata TaxID=230809 RepID=A0AAD7HMN5_9AGAR|nr:hypothetical protein DFH07DRAFT_783404 [Mycena maculata]
MQIPVLDHLHPQWAIVSFTTQMVQEARFPHKALYRTEPSSNAGDVIRPLISDDQSFDIAVSVWARASEDEETEFKRSTLGGSPVEAGEAAAPSKLDLAKWSCHSVWKETTGFGMKIFLKSPCSPILCFGGYFSLGSENPSEKTMADLALESFSISVPLIEFHDASRQCEDRDTDDVVANHHPYVVTRTQLRVVRETRLFDTKAYNGVRDEIKRHSCGQGFPGLQPHLKMCRRTYKSNGDFETRLLEVPTESGVETQWAYAPYLDTKPHSAGPLVSVKRFFIETSVLMRFEDIIPAPVDRENCSLTPKDDYMDVSWRIAYGGRSPSKQIWADNFISPYSVNPHASELAKVSGQIEAELGACQVLAALLLFHYWWTRVSTVSISSSSVTFLAVGNALGPVLDAIQDASVVFVAPLAVIVPGLMCKAITRTEFGWCKCLTSVWTKLGAFVAFVAAHLADLDKISLLASTIPDALPGEYSPQSPLLNLLRTVASGFCFAGIYSQAFPRRFQLDAPLRCGCPRRVLLNHRSHAFGGGYRAEIIIACMGRFVDLLYFVPAVVGRMDARMGLTLKPLVDIGMHIPLLWQAIVLPPVEVGDDEED